VFFLQDSLRRQAAGTSVSLRVVFYMRLISDAKGNKRMDENVIGNFRTGRWMRVEAGFRQGERPQAFDSYYHYKLELQSIYFWKLLRLFARISDNVINVPSPSYRRTNKLFVLEGKYALYPALQINGGLGYLFSSQQDHVPDALPTFRGKQVNFPVFKVSLRYDLGRAFAEFAYGSYDVFNPYPLEKPFVQVAGELEIGHACNLFSYFRYQYDRSVKVPDNYFLGLGLLFHSPPKGRKL
jgi:hypothetical protein